MDYKKVYLEHYTPTFQQHEKWIKEKLIEYKKEDRTYFSAENKIRQSLQKDYSAIPPKNQQHFYQEIVRTLEARNTFYSNNRLSKILSIEIKDFYEDNEGLGLDSYDCFIQSFANFQGIYDAHNFYGRITNIVKIYYDLDELDKFKLEAVKQYKEHSQYIGLAKSKFSNYDQLDQDRIELDREGKFTYKEKNADSEKDKVLDLIGKEDSALPLLDNEEKLLLIHYLISAKSLDDIDKIKILALLDTPPIDISIFKEKSRENRQYNIINKGYNYFGKKTGLKLLYSLYDQIQYLKINNLNRAIKMDLNKLKQQELK